MTKANIPECELSHNSTKANDATLATPLVLPHGQSYQGQVYMRVPVCNGETINSLLKQVSCKQPGLRSQTLDPFL